MMFIGHFEWQVGRAEVLWVAGGNTFKRAYESPIRSVTLLHDRSGIAIVEPLLTYGVDNAVIINADDSLRFRLSLPVHDGTVYGFDQIYYVGDELTAIVAFTGHDVAYVVDAGSGSFLRHYETR